ncbi:MAG: PAS domain S-box protein [Bryobacterales bacterium]|nr:PAS domain S-box protein [Bryobacterales bacterium]
MSHASAGADRADFLSGGGQMAAMIRSFDWRGHPLGYPESWPQSLKTAVSIILNSQHPMWIGWGTQIWFLYNDAYLHVLGEAKHAWALGRPASEVWAEIWDVCGPLADKVFGSGEASFVDDVRLYMNRGSYLEETFYSFSYSPIRDESGAVGGLFCPSTDVTPKVVGARRLRTLSGISSRALTEKTVRDACARVAEALAENPDDIPFALLYLVTGNGELQLAEGVALEEVATAQHWPVEEVLESGRFKRVKITGLGGGFPAGPAGQPVTEAMILPVAGGAQEKPIGVLIAGRNPTRPPVDPAYDTFFQLVAGQVATAIQNATAVEDERRRAEALAEIDRAKTAFFSNVSHEFRTPLTLLLGPLEDALKAQRGEGEEQRTRLEMAHRNALRLLRLVNSLLDFSRIEAGRISASYTPVDLAALTSDLASNFRSLMEGVGLEFVVECEPLPEPVYVDRDMWEKIVFNLLSNAFKFTLSGGVTVRLEGRGRQAVLTVADTGIGIEQSQLAHVFERFHRVEGAQGRTFEGTGIGLALIQELVKLHGGSVEARSTPGKGSEFTVRVPFGHRHLPAERIGRSPEHHVSTALRADVFVGEAQTWTPAEDRKAAAAAGGTRESAAPSKPRILIADDNGDMRAHLLRLLGGDYDAQAVGDGVEALKAVRERAPDLLIADVMMPALDGFGLLKAWRQDPALREIPVILLSARAGEEARTEGIAAGADDYLTKPFAAQELLARVETTLALQHIRREARAAIEASEERYRAILEQVTDGIFVATPEGRYVDANSAGAAMFGYTREELLEVPFEKMLAEEELERLPKQLARLEAGEIDRDDWRFRRKDGTTFVGELVARQMPNGRLQGVLRDVTESRKITEALKDSEERFRALVTASSDVMYRMSADWSEMWQLTGRSFLTDMSEPRRSWMESYLLEEDRPEIWKAIEAAIAGKQMLALEHRVLRADGTVGWTFSRAVPLLGEHGEIKEWFGAAQDITARKRAELLDQEQMRVLEKIAAGHAMAECLEAVTDAADKLQPAAFSAVLVATEDGKAVRDFLSARMPRTFAEALLGTRVDAERAGPCCAAVATSVPQICEDIRTDDRWPVEWRELCARHGIRAAYSVPVCDSRKKAVASFTFFFIKPHGVDDWERRISSFGAHVAGIALERHRATREIEGLNEQLSRDVAALRRIQQVRTDLTGSAALEERLQEILAAAADLTGAAKGNVQIYDRENQSLRMAVWQGFGEPFLSRFRDEGSAVVCDLAARRAERLIWEDVAADPLLQGTKDLEIILGDGIRAIQSTPMLSLDGRVLGLLNTHYGAPHRLSEKELRYLDLLARMAADFIERKQDEEALRASETRFRQLAEVGPQFVWINQPDGRIEYVNRRWVEYSGLEVEKTVNTASFASVIHPEDGPAMLEAWSRSLATGETLECELRMRGKDGTYRWYVTRSVALKDASGEIVKWFGVSTDIDEQKRVQEELRQANADLEQFAYSASHDLQEPLRGLKIYSEILGTRYGSKLDGQAGEFLKHLRNSASRMEMLVRDLLAYTQAAQSERPATPTPAGEALAHAVANLTGAIVESGARITNDPLPEVRMHATELQQLFQNLVGNAVKYRRPDTPPVIHVTASRNSTGWHFRVIDNGIGIDPQFKERIFGLFKRLHTNDEYSGTGIGLALCQRIVERHHGRIWVESELGKGSEFHFTLPE